MKNLRWYTLPPILIINLTNIIVDVVETFLILRLLLKLFGASISAPFVQWIYETTDPLLWPFHGIFPSPSLARGFLIEFSTLFAIIIYLLVAYLITEILDSLIFRADQRLIRSKE
jgi:uncharacterized protein YggT (Ycf19 family)